MHGGRSQSREALPGEDPRELEALKQDCIRDLNAGTTTERFLAENVALCQWRLRRAGRAEAAALALQLHTLDEGFEDQATAAVLRLIEELESRPADVVLELRGSTLGLLWLRDQWAMLLRQVETYAGLAAAQFEWALRLQGRHLRDWLRSREIQQWVRAYLGAHFYNQPINREGIVKRLSPTKPETMPDREYREEVDKLIADLPGHVEANATLRARIREVLSELDELAPEVEAREARDRALKLEAAQGDPAIKTLVECRTKHEGSLNAALRTFEKVQKLRKQSDRPARAPKAPAPDPTPGRSQERSACEDVSDAASADGAGAVAPQPVPGDAPAGAVEPRANFTDQTNWGDDDADAEIGGDGELAREVVGAAPGVGSGPPEGHAPETATDPERPQHARRLVDLVGAEEARAIAEASRQRMERLLIAIEQETTGQVDPQAVAEGMARWERAGEAARGGNGNPGPRDGEERGAGTPNLPPGRIGLFLLVLSALAAGLALGASGGAGSAQPVPTVQDRAAVHAPLPRPDAGEAGDKDRAGDRARAVEPTANFDGNAGRAGPGAGPGCPGTPGREARTLLTQTTHAPTTHAPYQGPVGRLKALDVRRLRNPMVASGEWPVARRLKTMRRRSEKGLESPFRPDYPETRSYWRGKPGKGELPAEARPARSIPQRLPRPGQPEPLPASILPAGPTEDHEVSTMRTFPVVVFTAVGACSLMWVPWAPVRAADDPAATLAAMTGLAPADQAEFADRFRSELWPLLTRENGAQKKSCVACHDDSEGNKSPLLFVNDPADDFTALLVDSYLDAENPLSLLAKVRHKNPKHRMPPRPGKEWSADEVATLRRFVSELGARRSAGRVTLAADEVFPPPLLSPFDGPRPDEGAGNTFLGFWQLKGKIKTIFEDDWRRDERDLFQENLTQFGGADFVRRFDESTKASPSFLSALDGLARDVASKAFLNGTGPFRGIDTERTNPDPADITRLYRTILYRNPTDAEQAAARAMFRDLETHRKALAGEDGTLAFELQLEDDQGLRTTQAFSIALTMDPHGLYQERIDESSTGGSDSQSQSQNPSESNSNSGALLRTTLAGTFHFEPGDRGQVLRVTNADTDGNVSVGGIAIRPLAKGAGAETEAERIVTVKDESVRLEGSWLYLDRDGVITCEDSNENKGESLLSFPIAVEAAGEYQMALLYRRSGGELGTERRGRRRRRRPDNATNVLVEVVSHDPSRLEQPRDLARPPAGEARFTVDQTVDNIIYRDLKTAFRFNGDDQYVEVNNAGTKQPVVADAVWFLRDGKKSAAVVIDDRDAEGHERWKPFDAGQFRPYNITGRGSLSDNGDKSETLSLRYVPAKVEGWDRSGFYRVAVGFPGKAGNETQAPIVVRASASSPIVRLQAPRHAHGGAEVTLDATASYNIQGTPLHARWVQVGGPEVKLSFPRPLQVTFKAPAMTPQQAAWEGLARALIAHPDFLFTRPVSLATARDPKERARLQLVKIALDLAGRSPTAQEIGWLENGITLADVVEHYLQSNDFREFYFHRVRLYLESQGTEEQDEPVRVWSYIAEHDRPFQEILTADYTVGPDMKKKERPAYHGRTGILTTKGFIDGKPGLPHFNYAAQVAEKFLGYVFEVPPEIVAAREGITATATTDPSSLCYSCHKVLTPLAFQREAWTDAGEYRAVRDGSPVDDTDHQLVESYPFKGKGMEAFALQAQKKERFVRTMINTHFVFFFGREMRYSGDERDLYKRLWDAAAASNYTIKGLIRALVLSPEYLDLEGSGGRS
jgi:hypothetical protein